MCSPLSKGQFCSTQKRGGESLFSLAVSQLLLSHDRFRCDSDTCSSGLRMPHWLQQCPCTHSWLYPYQLYQQTPATYPKKSNPQKQPTKGGADSKCQPYPTATDGKRAQSKVWMLWKANEQDLQVFLKYPHEAQYWPYLKCASSYCNQSRKPALITNASARKEYLAKTFLFSSLRTCYWPLLETGFWVSWSDAACQFLS